MQYLGLALYAEGATDYYFLRPLLQRLCEDVCAKGASSPVDVSEVLPLNHPEALNDASREERISAAAELARGAWQILFIHADGGNAPVRARQEQVDPSLEVLVQKELGGVGVAVVPVRETEAWIIVDGDSIRGAFGTNLTDQALCLPAKRSVEKDADPKAVLDEAFVATSPTGRRRKQGVSPYLNTLGERVSLDELRSLESFSALERELVNALRELNILH